MSAGREEERMLVKWDPFGEGMGKYKAGYWSEDGDGDRLHADERHKYAVAVVYWWACTGRF